MNSTLVSLEDEKKKDSDKTNGHFHLVKKDGKKKEQKRLQESLQSDSSRIMQLK